MAQIKLKHCLYTIVIPLFISLLFYNFSVHPYSGSVQVSRNLNSPISIERDNYGIPHIKGQTYEDVLFGMGFAHAQDRLWNMHLRRLMIKGRLSELFGDEVIEIDKSFKTLNLDEVAIGSIQNLPQETLNLMQAYTDGINQYVATLRLLPFEFYLLGSTYEKFEVIDIVVLQKLLAFAMTFDWSNENLRERLAEVVGRDWASQMIPHRTKDFYGNQTTILNEDDLKKMGLYKKFEASEEAVYSPTDPLRHIDIQYTAETVEEPHEVHKNAFYDLLNMNNARGSNSWVISGKHTKSGKPLIVNDPHLDNNMPSYWYQASLCWGDGEFITGIGFPGLPFIPIGRSNYGAYSLTAVYTDAADVFQEKIDKDNKNYYYDGKWYPLKVREVEINVKGSDPVKYTVYETRHGPILDNVFAEVHLGRGGPKYTPHNYSLAWTGFVSNDTSIHYFFKTAFAKTGKELFDVTENYLLPPNSLHFALENGDIGWIALGRIPKRKNPSRGGFVRDGTNKEDDWEGLIPWSEHPKVLNPEKGYVISANNKIAPDDIIHRTSMNMWTIPRANRIEEMITEKINSGHKFTVDDMKAMLTDEMDVFARAITPQILKLFKKYYAEFASEVSQYNSSKINQHTKITPWGNPKHLQTKVSNTVKLNSTSQKNAVNIQEILNYLESWDGIQGKDSVPAAIYNVWEYFFFMKSLRGLGFNEHERQAIISNIVYEQFIFKKIESWLVDESAHDEFWCKSPEYNHTRSCIYNLVISFYEARDYLNDKLGSNTKEWRWGKIHRQEFKNIPFSETPLKFIWHRSFEAGGNTRTVNVASRYIEQHNFDGIHGPNMRYIADMSERRYLLSVLDTGVSDRVFSKHYEDQMELHRQGKMIEIELGDQGYKKYESKMVVYSEKSAKK